MAVRRWVIFAWLWLTVGFSTGTTTLLGPVRRITGYGRGAGWSEYTEAVVVRLVILVFLAASVAVAVWLTRVVLRSRARHVRFGVPVATGLAALVAVALWLTPALVAGGGAEPASPGSSFTFGPIPDEARMAGLQAEGYTAVVSLLHPAVVPFEPRLIVEGRDQAARAGLEYIHVPMLPWVSGNADALARIEALAREGQGRYYVHCYLGQDRVRLARRAVLRSEPNATVEHIGPEPLLEDGLVFERGEVVELDDGVFLTPHPTHDELMRWILPGDAQRVVSLLDPDHPEDRPWIERERDLLAIHRVRLTVLPVRHDRFDPEAVLAAARQVRAMARPVVVHAFLSPGSGRSPSAEGFLQAYRADLPPLPPSLFAEALAGGEVRIVAPNVAVGPHPRPHEIERMLAPRGVREMVYLGEAEDDGAPEDESAAAAAGVGWRATPLDATALRAELAGGGPWYLYGPGLPVIEPRVAEALGPAIPPRPRLAIARPVDRAEPVEAPAIEAPPPPASMLRRFVDRTVPSPQTIVLAAPVLVLVAAAAGAFAGWLRVARGVRAAFTRKTFHFVIFSLAAVLHLAGGLPLVSLFGGIVTLVVLYAVVRGDGFPFYEAMARPTDAPRRTLFILIPLATTAVGGMASALLFGAFAYVGYLVAGWGDAVGEPVGSAFGRTRYRVPSLGGVPATRSLEGSAAVFAVGALAAGFGLAIGGIPIASALVVGLLCGAVGAAVEAFSNHGLDNLTIQVAAAGTAYLLLVG